HMFPHAVRQRADSVARDAGCVDGLVYGDGYVAGADHQPPFLHDMPAPRDADRHDRHTRLQREHERSSLEARNRSVHAARPFGEDDQRMMLPHEPGHLLDDAGARPRSIDEQMSRPLQVPSETGDLPERVLRDNAQLIRKGGEDDWNVVDALVVRGEELAARLIDSHEAIDVHPHPRRLQNQARPRARTLMTEITASVENGGQER